MISKSFVLKRKRNKNYEWDYKTIILFTIFLCGVIFGIFVYKNSSEEGQNFICSLTRNYLYAKKNSNFIMCFSGFLLIMLLFVFVDFLLGLCAIGTPLVWAIPMLFGMVCGIFSSCLFTTFGLKGWLYCICVDLVCYATTAATLIKCCCESTKMSVELLCCAAENNRNKNVVTFKDYLISYIILCVPIVIAAILSTICFKIFAGIFIFL